jgi:hypothetical protein
MTNEVLKKNNISLNKSIENKLSIQFNLDGFSFSIYNTITKKQVYFSEYIFEYSQTSPEQLLTKIEDIFEKDTRLQNDFVSVTAIHQNNLATLVPDIFFDENKLASYLDVNIKTLPSDFITFDALSGLSAKNIYIPYVNVNNYLFHNFGAFEFKHHRTVFIEKLLLVHDFKEKTMYVNVSKTSLDIVVLEQKQLVFSNTFSHHSKEDFIYYILFVAEQLQLNVQKTSLYFTGKIGKTSPLFEITYRYINKVFFLESNDAIYHKFNIPLHANFILLGT